MSYQNIQEKDKNFFKSAIIAAISQKGSNIYQDFKIIKINPVTVDGQNYMLVDFKYTLLTGAGFEVERQGVASVTSVGDGVQLLWAASISARLVNSSVNCFLSPITLSLNFVIHLSLTGTKIKRSKLFEILLKVSVVMQMA